jgi:hypothetical protein
MPIEVVCGQCHGALLAEEAGSVVACPHCGAHLQVPRASTNSGAPSTLAAVDERSGVSEDRAPTRPDPAPPADLVKDASTHEPADDSDWTPLAELPSHSTPRMTFSESMPQLVVGLSSAVDPSPVLLSPTAARPPANAGGSPMVPRIWFLLVASYASAVTFAFLFLLFLLSRWKTHSLENLPDVVPKIQNGETALEVAPPEAAVPPAHVLALGQTRRFGSVRVTPLRVTEGRLEFEHLLNDPDAKRSPSRPVLKLWIRFENVSAKQTFAPLDSLLAFKRHYQDSGAVLTNQFLCRTDERRRDGKLHYLFELSSSSEFRIAGQNLGAVLGPGQAVEMFLPSEEQIGDLRGPLVWRVHFRKGYHPRTRHGVTTLIDVPFHRDDVQRET